MEVSRSNDLVPFGQRTKCKPDTVVRGFEQFGWACGRTSECYGYDDQFTNQSNDARRSNVDGGLLSELGVHHGHYVDTGSAPVVRPRVQLAAFSWAAAR